MIENSWLTYLSWISLTLFKDSHCSYLQYLWQNVPGANYAVGTHEKLFIFALNCSHVVLSRSHSVWHNIHLLYKVPDFISVYHVCLRHLLYKTEESRHLLYKLKNPFQLKKTCQNVVCCYNFLFFFFFNSFCLLLLKWPKSYVLKTEVMHIFIWLHNNGAFFCSLSIA